MPTEHRSSEQSPALRGGLIAHPAVPYVLPFALFMVLLASAEYLKVLGRWEFPLRVAILAAVLLAFSRHVVDLRVRHFAGTLLLGVGVFVLWIAPDLLFPGYRNSVLFQNGVLGKLTTSIPSELLSDPLALTFRFLRAVIIVPIVEELFWRAWLMRYLISPKFETVPLGQYSAQAFFLTALLFASEHGPFWDVGLLAGIVYNWWMVRTRSLGDCIWAHAITNACLSAYVIATGKWEYWL